MAIILLQSTFETSAKQGTFFGVVCVDKEMSRLICGSLINFNTSHYPYIGTMYS